MRDLVRPYERAKLRETILSENKWSSFMSSLFRHANLHVSPCQIWSMLVLL